MFGFKSNGSSVIFEISANTNIFSENLMFIGNIDPETTNLVATIGGKDRNPRFIVTFLWPFTDDEGQIHTDDLNSALYFPD